VDDFLLDSGSMDAIFELFFGDPLENILHLVITRIFVEILQNNHQKLRNFLVHEKKMFNFMEEKISDGFFRPHLTVLGNCIIEVSKICKNYSEMIHATGHAIFFAQRLLEINKANHVVSWQEEVKTVKNTSGFKNSELVVDFSELPLNLITDPGKLSKKIFTCSLCGENMEDNSIQCPKCRSLSYCSRDCQKKHWREGHSKECRT
jgi:hypothetical protein